MTIQTQKLSLRRAISDVYYRNIHTT